MTDAPDLDSTPDDVERPGDPMTVAYEDFQESERFREAVEAVRRQKVDDVDAGAFMKRDISLQEVVGGDAAVDVANEGIIHGFEAGFEYGARGSRLSYYDPARQDSIAAHNCVFEDGTWWFGHGMPCKHPALHVAPGEREALIEEAAWVLIEGDTDTADRGVSDEHYRERRADVEKVFPVLFRRTVTTEEVSD